MSSSVELRLAGRQLNPSKEMHGNDSCFSTFLGLSSAHCNRCLAAASITYHIEAVWPLKAAFFSILYQGMDLITPDFHDSFLDVFLGDSAPSLDTSSEKKRPASEAIKDDESNEGSTSRRSATPEPAKKKKKMDPVFTFNLFL